MQNTMLTRRITKTMITMTTTTTTMMHNVYICYAMLYLITTCAILMTVFTYSACAYLHINDNINTHSNRFKSRINSHNDHNLERKQYSCIGLCEWTSRCGVWSVEKQVEFRNVFFVPHNNINIFLLSTNFFMGLFFGNDENSGHFFLVQVKFRENSSLWGWIYNRNSLSSEKWHMQRMLILYSDRPNSTNELFVMQQNCFGFFCVDRLRIEGK